MIEVFVTFPESCQVLLSELVPCMRKAVVGYEMLSEFQRNLVRDLPINMLSTPINVADFSPQYQILTLDYITLLHNLGVRVEYVNRVFSATSHPIFRDVISKMLTIKSWGANEWFKGLAKKILNSSFGFLMLRVDRFKQSKLVGEKQMRNLILSPFLDSFVMIQKNIMLAYLTKKQIWFNALLPLGCHVLQNSKKNLLHAYYMNIRPKLFLANIRQEILSCDTDSVYLYLSTNSLEESGRNLSLTDVFYILRDFLDFSFMLSESGEKSLCLIEMEARYGSSLIEEVKQNFHRPGVFKIESPYLDGMFESIVVSIIFVREKAYAMRIAYRINRESEWRYGYKLAAKGPVPKKRISQYRYQDFSGMCDIQRGPIYAENIINFKKRAFELFQVQYKRREITIFSRKRFIRKQGEASVPFNFFKTLKNS